MAEKGYMLGASAIDQIKSLFKRRPVIPTPSQAGTIVPPNRFGRSGFWAKITAFAGTYVGGGGTTFAPPWKYAWTEQSFKLASSVETLVNKPFQPRSGTTTTNYAINAYDQMSSLIAIGAGVPAEVGYAPILPVQVGSIVWMMPTFDLAGNPVWIFSKAPDANADLSIIAPCGSTGGGGARYTAGFILGQGVGVDYTTNFVVAPDAGEYNTVGAAGGLPGTYGGITATNPFTVIFENMSEYAGFGEHFLPGGTRVQGTFRAFATDGTPIFRGSAPKNYNGLFTCIVTVAAGVAGGTTTPSTCNFTYNCFFDYSSSSPVAIPNMAGVTPYTPRTPNVAYNTPGSQSMGIAALWQGAYLLVSVPQEYRLT